MLSVIRQYTKITEAIRTLLQRHLRIFKIHKTEYGQLEKYEARQLTNF